MNAINAHARFEIEAAGDAGLADGVVPATSRAVRGPPNEDFGLPPGRANEGHFVARDRVR
jgi:hypothetical protein